MAAASASASRPTPSMKLEVRRHCRRSPSTKSPGAAVTPPLVRDLALGVEDRDPEPAVVAGVAGRPDHAADALRREVEAAGGARRMRRDLPRRRVRGRLDPGRGDVRVDPRQHPAKPGVRGGAMLGEGVAQRQPPAVGGLDAAGDADAVGGEPRQVDRPVAPRAASTAAAAPPRRSGIARARSALMPAASIQAKMSRPR